MVLSLSARTLPFCLALICLVLVGPQPNLGHAAPVKTPTLSDLVPVAAAGRLPSSMRTGLLGLAASVNERSGALALLAVDGLGRGDVKDFCAALNSLQANPPDGWRQSVVVGLGHCAIYFADDLALIDAVDRLDSIRGGPPPASLATLHAARYTAHLRRDLATAGGVPAGKLDRAVVIWAEVLEMGAALADEALVELSSNHLLALTRLQAGTESALVVAPANQITGIDRKLWARLAQDVGQSPLPGDIAALAREVLGPRLSDSMRARKRKAGGTFLTINGGLMAGLSLGAGALLAANDYVGPWALGVAAPFAVAGLAQVCVGIPLLTTPPRKRGPPGSLSAEILFLPVPGGAVVLGRF